MFKCILSGIVLSVAIISVIFSKVIVCKNEYKFYCLYVMAIVILYITTIVKI